MAESVAELMTILRDAVRPGSRGRLLDRGLARGLIWQEGRLPEGAPEFSAELSDDLLDYGHAVIALALRLRLSNDADAQLVERAFLVGGEAIESAVHRGQERIDRGFHRVTAAVAFHLGRFASRAYSMLPGAIDGLNLAPTEAVLVGLLRRQLDDVRVAYSAWLFDPDSADRAIALRLEEDDEFSQADAINHALTTSFMRGLALFDHALSTGDSAIAADARARLFATADAAQALNAVGHWWTATLAAHLVDELWGMSLYRQVPELPPDHDDHARWHELRRGYIQRLRRQKRAAIELWPSQVLAARRAPDVNDDLVVALPTGAGKTRIAELCLLRTLASKKRVVYVTPLRALSAQIERDLADSLQPLGFSVSSLYGAAGIELGDAEALRHGRVVVSTPEKLDFALRNDPTVIDDVGLIVLDEGHMLGPNEREVRYEALVQRLVRRGDAVNRRLVCLSALFPTPEEMRDLVAWIRADEPGEPVHSSWRPTRQRFGTLRWGSQDARLEVRVEEENPFIPRFIEQKAPPVGSRRRRAFPAEKNELTVAAAWRFVEQQKDVLVYCAMRSSVETLGSLLLRCIGQGVLPSLGRSTKRLKDAIEVGTEWLGADHPAVACLEHGVALHHGGLPRPFLHAVERALRAGDCRLTIASPTLAQGLNLSASILLVPSIWRNGEVIPSAEFGNVAGRAGRPFVDVEGLVLHVVWEHSLGDTHRAVRNWEKLVRDAQEPKLASGILQLSIKLFDRVALKAGVGRAEVLEYVLNQSAAWDCDLATQDLLEVSPKEWNRDVASLDSAILALLDGETADGALDQELDIALSGSLFSRELARREVEVQLLLRAFVTARAKRIWSETTPAQRRGFHYAGIGLSAGQFISANLDVLIALLAQAEKGIWNVERSDAGKAVVEFAEFVFQTAPFQAPKPLPAKWRNALLAWLFGEASADVLSLCEDEGVDLVQEALTYRLPWAMEAVRVHARAVEHEGANSLSGLAALAVEVGSVNVSVITLLRAGLESREAAAIAVRDAFGLFTDRDGMRVWLGSTLVRKLSTLDDWPTKRSRQAWLSFVEGEQRVDQGRWARERQVVNVEWYGGTAPSAGCSVRVETLVGNEVAVMTPDCEVIGALAAKVARARADVVDARVDVDGNVVIEFFGPRTSP